VRIDRVEAFLMSCPLAEPLVLPFWGGTRTITKRDAMFVRVTTDAGLTGYAPGPADESVAREIRETIDPALGELDPLRWKQFNLPWSKAWSVVQMALMDVQARAEQRPLSEVVWDGRRRDRIKLYGSAGMYMPPERYAEEAAAVKAAGFPAYKYRPGGGPDDDLRTLELVRAAVGPDFDVMVDAHTWWRMGERSYTFERVAEIARAMAPLRPTWLEEPLPPQDLGAYERLRRISPIPLAAGEHEADLPALAWSRVVGVVQADVCCQGGFHEIGVVIEAVKDAGLQFAFHSWGTALEVLAAAHLGICWPESVVSWLEYPCYAGAGRAGMYPFPLADEILAEPLPIECGHLVVPDGPGLGIDVDERVVERYPYVPGPWSTFRIDSPPHTIAVTGDHSIRGLSQNQATGKPANRETRQKHG
jgi:L-alanine-DL-glutamate epimerase-like enolase superfamily enzyme